MFNKINSKDKIFGIIVVTFIVTTIIGIVFGLNVLLTKLLIWVINGLFNYDLSEKFWYVFFGMMLLPILIRPPELTINIGQNNEDK